VVDERLQQRLRAALVQGAATVSYVTDAPRVLDACGGSGNASLILMSLGLRPVTVDISPEMLEIYREKAVAQGYAPECVTSELADFLRNDSRGWDMIVFSSALHHFEDPEAMLDLAGARTAPGGVIVTMFDPIRVGRLGRHLRKIDYLLHVIVRTPERLAGLVRARLSRGEMSGQPGDHAVGEMAERHALVGLDDMAIRARFARRGWRILDHDRRYEGRFRITRIVFRVLHQYSSFSFIVQAPHPDAHQDLPFSRLGSSE
jgi:SAM-dependent methyltransferase